MASARIESVRVGVTRCITYSPPASSSTLSVAPATSSFPAGGFPAAHSSFDL